MPSVETGWPLYRIDEGARPQALGRLRRGEGGGFRFDSSAARPALLHGDFAAGLFPRLPWFLHDLRPQGFTGRACARRLVASGVEVPIDPEHWTDEDCLQALLQDGAALPGDLLLGQGALDAALQCDVQPLAEVACDERADRYPRLADAVLVGDAVGTPVAGQQPKFAITRRDAGGPVPVIVKFSGPVTTPDGRRWADLLIGEHHAGEVLRENAVPAACSELLHAGDRVFLESTRFDRTPSSGRRGQVSLRALDAGFYGRGRADWRWFSTQLGVDGWLGEEDARRLRVIAWFGDLIANTDMHLGNVSLRFADARPLALAPVYDMLPMRFRPSAGGGIVEHRYHFALPPRESLGDWRPAAGMARVFWRRVASDERISLAFRAIARDAGDVIERAARHLGA